MIRNADKMFCPKDLRITSQGKPQALLEIEKNPGYYKWWATKKDFKLLLSELGGNFNEVLADIEQKDGLYCIYVGIAVKESIQRRINWHVNDKHNAQRVKSGFLSTLRKSISSVIAKNQNAKDVTNEFMNRLKIEVFYSNYKIKSSEAKDELETIEKQLMKNHLYILNIRDNAHPKCTQIKKNLSRLRKEGKKA